MRAALTNFTSILTLAKLERLRLGVLPETLLPLRGRSEESGDLQWPFDNTRA